MPGKQSKTTYEISLRVKDAAQGRVEILKEMLHKLGVAENKIVELAKNGCIYLSLYFSDAAQARKTRNRLAALKLRRVLIQSKSLRKKDWQTKWKEDFKPFKMTANFTVVPAWLRKKYRKNDRNIYLGTGLAFGTGMHATTRFMAQMIEQCRRRFESFIDLGTGTGILTLVALRCGVCDVTAIDISREAVKTARANFQDNGFRGYRLQAVGLQKFKDKKKYDFVAAVSLVK